MTIKDNIRRLREARNMTQEELANAVGVTRPAVTQWESGWSQPRMGMISKLAEFFQVGISEILEGPGGGDSPVFSSGDASVPLLTLGRVHAGDFSDEDEIERRVDVPASVLRNHPDARALTVQGDCMNKVVPEGMCVVFDPNIEPQNGSIAIVETEEYTALMRRWYRGAGTLMLVADSFEQYEDIVLKEEDGPIRVLGTVVWIQSSEELE